MRQLLRLETLLLSICGGVFALAILIEPDLIGLSPTTQALVLSGALAAVCISAFLLNRSAKDHSLYSPLSFELFLLVAFYALPAAYSVTTDNDLYYLLTRLEDNLPRIMAIVFLGTLAFLVGYGNPLARELGRGSTLFAFDLDDSSLKRMWWLAFAATWTARAALFASGIYLQGGSSQSASATYISFFGGFLFLAQLCLCMSFDRYLDVRAQGALRSTVFWRRAFYFSLALEYLYVLPTGSKGGVLLPIFLLLGIVVLRGRKFSVARIAAGTCLVIGAYYVFLPVSNAYREATYQVGIGWEKEVSVQGIYTLLEETYDRLLSADTEVYWRDAEARSISRVSYPATMNEVMKYLDRGGEPLMGWSYYIAFLTPIPRAVWPDKPNITLGRFYGGLFGGDEITSFAISVLGELYINFLLPGVLFGMFLYGIMYRGLWNLFVDHLMRSHVARSLYLIVWLQVLAIGAETNFAGLFGGMIKVALIVGGIVILARTRGRGISVALTPERTGSRG
jgi:hypothetical protein